MTLKKQHLETIFSFVKGTEGSLTLAESRARDIFIKPLLEVTKTYIEDRNKIYLAFCNKNEDGTPNLIDGDKYEFPKEKLDEINKELITLAEEEVEINTYAITKEILDKSEYKPKLGETEVIDEFLAKI